MIIYYYDFKTKVETPIGAIWLNKQDANLANKTNEFIKNNIKENENFVVIPEGLLLHVYFPELKAKPVFEIQEISK